MKAGDLVCKVGGRDTGKSGVVLAVYNRGEYRREILSVLVDGKVENWAAHLTETSHREDTRNG